MGVSDGSSDVCSSDLASLWGLGVTDGLRATIVAGIVVGVFAIGGQIVLYGMAPSVYPTLSRSTGVGAAVAFGRMGAIAGPLIAGHLLAIGLSPAAVLIAAIPCVVLAGMCALLLVPPRRVSRVADNRAAGV